jgi:hypothetical protein
MDQTDNRDVIVRLTNIQKADGGEPDIAHLASIFNRSADDFVKSFGVVPLENEEADALVADANDEPAPEKPAAHYCVLTNEETADYIAEHYPEHFGNKFPNSFIDLS